MYNQKYFSVKSMVELALFSAIIFILGMTPLGYIPGLAFKISTVHIPVIIGSIILGWKRGAVLGFIFGLTSLINSTIISPTPMSMFFSPFISGNLLSLVICFLPRILVGVVPCFIFKLFKNSKKYIKNFGLCLAGAFGAITNTLFVMSFIYIFFKNEYAQINDLIFSNFFNFIFLTVGINAIFEIITASLFTFCIYRVLIKVINN